MNLKKMLMNLLVPPAIFRTNKRLQSLSKLMKSLRLIGNSLPTTF